MVLGLEEVGATYSGAFTKQSAVSASLNPTASSDRFDHRLGRPQFSSVGTRPGRRYINHVTLHIDRVKLSDLRERTHLKFDEAMLTPWSVTGRTVPYAMPRHQTLAARFSGGYMAIQVDR